MYIIANRKTTNSAMIPTKAPKRMNVDSVFHAYSRECFIPFSNASMSVRTTDGRILVNSFPVGIITNDEERTVSKNDAIRTVEVIHIACSKGSAKFLTGEYLTVASSVVSIKNVGRKVSGREQIH